MAIWVCRAGKKSIYVEEFLRKDKIFCIWDGFKYDLTTLKDKEDLKEKIWQDKRYVSQTSVNTWASQLLCFRDRMKKGDLVLTPNENSKSFNIGIICGDYVYNSDAEEHFYHSRHVKWLKEVIDKKILPQYMVYSLGAYRTIFGFKYEKEFMKILESLDILI